MSKNFKLVLALALAAMMIAGSFAAMADPDYWDGMDMTTPVDKDIVISISGLDAGDTVKFYQILEWKGVDDGNTWGGWKLVAPFDGIVNAGDPELKDAKTAIGTIVGDNNANPAVVMKLSAAIAGKLADLAITGTPRVYNGSAVSNGTSTYTLPTAEKQSALGLYMALITPHEAETVYNPVFVSADYNSNNTTNSFQIGVSQSSYYNNGAAKKSLITLTKEDRVDDGQNGTSYDDTQRATRVGEVVHYTVTTTIPGYGPVYTSPVFTIKDKLTGLELKTGTVSVTVEGGANLDTDYTVAATTSGYTVEFKPTYLTGVAAPKTVTITYDATVTAPAEYKNVNDETNEVWVEYSHDPTDEDDKDYKKDDTKHYTFTIDADVLGGYDEGIRYSGSEIIKVGVDASGNPITESKTYSQVTTDKFVQSPLEGAQFKLYKANADGTQSNEEYTKVGGGTLSLSSDSYGRIKIEGLDAGTYWLVETQAPSGYIKSTVPVKIEIIPHYTNETVTMYTDGTDWYYADDTLPSGKTLDDLDSAEYKVEVLQSYDVLVNGVKTTHTFFNEGKTVIKESNTGTVELPSSIPNTKGVELPSTGGIGTTIFYVGGSLMVLAAAILLITKRRMGVEE